MAALPLAPSLEPSPTAGLARAGSRRGRARMPPMATTTSGSDSVRGSGPSHPLTGLGADPLRPHRRRWAVFRRALRQEVSRLHDRRRILAMILLIITFGSLAAGLIARGEPAGADARA